MIIDLLAFVNITLQNIIPLCIDYINCNFIQLLKYEYDKFVTYLSVHKIQYAVN